ncbi:hypothetical protein FA15DRAFT_695155 [Coprinopsis marcescibilis]|uniref:Microtubule associated protein n=1 Tax=Coprinopsis marcescibilis TaxID=230819 RepID=A0A5C3KRT0_COPMA|nr:hypothetical protein FA15DRAFT_695155 [Coprinopsis marcescibilis]
MSTTTPATTTGTPTAVSPLKSLLDSLHAHLQTQTQLLPDLHAQLGLPPSAIQDELKSLQDQLIQGVKRQIDTRRKQVEEWKGKIVDVESVCATYTQALGRKPGECAVATCKEESLPKRYDILVDFQEKLKQAYHTKLEQLTTLTNRIHVLEKTLGDEFFDIEIIEPIMEDPEAPRDVSQDRFLKLEKELVRGKAEVTKRLQQLSTSFLQIEWLHSELGITQEDFLASSSPTYSSFALGASSNDPFSISTPTPASRSNSQIHPMFLQHQEPAAVSPPATEADFYKVYQTFVERIEAASSSTSANSNASRPPSNPNPNIPLGLENVEPTLQLLAWATQLVNSLTDLKRTRERHIQAMYDQLEVLWTRLGVSEQDIDAFVDVNRGSTRSCVKEYEEELERMMELKRERMGLFVSNAREEIEKLWDDVMVGEQERADFAPFFDDEFTEDLLTLHEHEIKRLKEERRAKLPILSAIKKYLKICEEEKELAESASDGSRLLGRGPAKGTGGKGPATKAPKPARDPGRLLREEKMRKRVAKEKPRLEQDLLSLLPQWEQESGEPFLVYGENMLNCLMETVEQENHTNGGGRRGTSSGYGPQANRPGSVPPPNTSTNGRAGSERPGSVPPSVGRAGGGSTTPSNGLSTSSNGSNGGRTGMVTPAVRPRSAMASSSNSMSTGSLPPSKRQRMGDGSAAPTPAASVSKRGTRQVLASHKGVNGSGSKSGRTRSTSSPSKIPMKTPGGAGDHRQGGVQPLPHPRMQQMPIPKPGTAHHGLGHGRMPTAMAALGGKRFPSASLSSSTSSAVAAVVGGKMERERTSFKPRPSLDRIEAVTLGGGATRGVNVGVVTEEDEELDEE